MDTETVGFNGVIVLIQYADDDGPIHLYNVWESPISETLRLLEETCEHDVCVFNLTFDWFHWNKLYNLLSLALKELGDVYPIDYIKQIAAMERRAIRGKCLKPKRALDLMLYSRKGPFQSLMERRAVRIRNFPAELAQETAQILEARLKLPEIYFAGRKERGPHWKIFPTKHPGLVDIVLRLQPRGTLKAIVEHLGLTDKKALKIGEEIGVDPAWNVKDGKKGYAPYSDVTGWADVIEHHISYWGYNRLGREYATDDIVYIRALWKYFKCPEPGDDDSELATMVGAVRWFGFDVDKEAVSILKNETLAQKKKVPLAPARVLKELEPMLSDFEKSFLTDRNGKISTASVVLKEIVAWEDHPAAQFCADVLEARKAKKRIELYDKLLEAEVFHPDFIVTGTLSNRMAGTGGLNATGMNKEKPFRQCFTFAPEGYTLMGGDFDAFEVTIADAVYNDPKLRKLLSEELECELCDGDDPECLMCEGHGTYKRKIHTLMAMAMYPGHSYVDITKTKGLPADENLYGFGKNGVFTMFYGGTDETLVKKYGVKPEPARLAFVGFGKEYPGVEADRKDTFNRFCSMRQPGGLGTRVVWEDPDEFVESFLGFRRYFTSENQICKELFELANNTPSHWKDYSGTVVRKEERGSQSLTGAAMSALFAAAFNVQATNMRAAANHKIQSPGAQITKRVQRKVWDLQPAGVHDFVVLPFQVHDEVLVVTKNGSEDLVTDVVQKTVEECRSDVPLLAIDWGTNLKSWADK